MLSLIYRAHFTAQTRPKQFLLAIGAAIFYGGMFFRNPGLALALLLASAIALYCALSMGNRLRLDARSLLGIGMATLVLAMVISPDSAHAAGGLAGWARSIKAQLGDIYDLLVYGAYGVGVVGIISGINNGKKKSDGDSQIKTSSIFGHVLGGVCLMLIGYFADSAAESVGASSGQMNKMPGGL
jgi:hypothetical protein